MTTLREAAQMALDALIDAADSQNWEMQQNIDQHGEWYRRSVYLKEAVAKSQETIKVLRAALAQPEKEPVAWMYDWYDETEDIDGVPIGGIVSDCISKDYDEAHSPTMGCHNIRPLYTASPQREWQGLTDEEYEAIREDGQFGKGSIRFKNLFEAIEECLREKNS